jgi:hypothetical protein
MFLFPDIKYKQYIWIMCKQYFSSSIYLFHIETSVKYFFSICYILLVTLLMWPGTTDTFLKGHMLVSPDKIFQ